MFLIHASGCSHFHFRSSQLSRQVSMTFTKKKNFSTILCHHLSLLTCKMVGCVMWCPLTNVKPSAWSGVTVQTPSCSDMRQCRGCIDGPNSCSAFVFAEPTSIGSVVSLTRLPPSPLCVISISIGPSRSVVMLPLPFDMPSGFFFRRLGCASAGRRRTWNMIDPVE